MTYSIKAAAVFAAMFSVCSLSVLKAADAGSGAPAAPGMNTNPTGASEQNPNANVPMPNAPNPNGTNPNTLNQNASNPPDQNLGVGNSAAPANTLPNQGQADRNRTRGFERQLFRGIREAVEQAPAGAEVGTSGMSGVQDLKVFRKNGKVVLSGTVRSQEEKDAVGARASAAAGEQQVVNELKVK